MSAPPTPVPAAAPSKERLFDGILGLTPLRIALFVALVVAMFPGIFSDANRILQFMDEHQFYNWEEADRLSIAVYKQLPLWNPYYCGGMVSSAAPESGVFAPDFVLRLIFGVAHGRRLALLLFMVLGMEGLYRLVRAIDGSAISGMFGAIALVACNRLVQTYLGMGWVNFFGFDLVPWVVLAIVKGPKDIGWRFIGGMFLGWIALAAGTYTAPYTGIAASFITLVMCGRCLSPWRPKELRSTLASSLTIAVVAGIVALPKLLPMMLVMRQYPRVFTPVENNDAWTLLGTYGHVYWLVLAFAVFALLWNDFWARLFFACAMLFLLLSMGQFSDWAPSSILRKLPLLAGLRFPDRFMVMFHIFAVLTATRGVSHLEDLFSRIGIAIWSKLGKPQKRSVVVRALVPLILTGFAAVIVVRYGREEVETLMEAVLIRPKSFYTLDVPREVDQPFKQHRGNRRDAHVFPAMNRGTLYCFVGIPLPESALLRADLAAEEYPLDPKLATVERLSWSPHEIRLKVDAKADTRVLVNQNYNPHWTVDVGRTVDLDKLLAIDVPAGTHTVTLRYRDGTTVFCLIVSLAAVLAMLGYLGKRELVGARDTLRQWHAWKVFPKIDLSDDAKTSAREAGAAGTSKTSEKTEAAEAADENAENEEKET